MLNNFKLLPAWIFFVNLKTCIVITANFFLKFKCFFSRFLNLLNQKKQILFAKGVYILRTEPHWLRHWAPPILDWAQVAPTVPQWNPLSFSDPRLARFSCPDLHWAPMTLLPNLNDPHWAPLISQWLPLSPQWLPTTPA